MKTIWFWSNIVKFFLAVVVISLCVSCISFFFWFVNYNKHFNQCVCRAYIWCNSWAFTPLLGLRANIQVQKIKLVRLKAKYEV